ncbi:unnamed protein product [Strongylus vulgaris]|uniref:Cadherin domain-containing protein n=1 Tax=Strongylus vulgaris TaxID=40348 RepID=A0A3P7KZS1_STRVU|nr:unnamed protein product [Strongylus vulgaris]
MRASPTSKLSAEKVWKGSAVRYSLGNVNAVVAVGETTGQVTFAGLPKLKSGIMQYEVLATNRMETTKAKLTVVIETESDCCARMEFEKSEYHLQMGSLPVLGTISVRGQQRPHYRLMNLNHRHYVVNADKEKNFEAAKSPAPKRAAGAHLVPVTVTTQDGAPTVYF